MDNFIPKLPERTNDGSFYEELAKSNYLNIKLQNVYKGGVRGYQLFVLRYMAPFTPYDRLFVNHEMGSGKSIIAKELIKMYAKCKLKTLMICPTQMHARIQFGEFYELYKNYLELISFTDIRNNDSKKKIEEKLNSFSLIIIDEIHCVHNKDDQQREKKRNYGSTVFSQYKQMLSFLTKAKLIKNLKIIIMSGTPLSKDLEKFYEILNFILPKEEEITFETNEKELVKKICGRISTYSIPYHKHIEEYIGEQIENYGIYYVNTMSKIQTNLFRTTNKFNSLLYAHHDVETFTRENLKNYSILYYTLLVHLGVFDDADVLGGESTTRRNEAAFFYNKMVESPGNLLLAKILRSFNFTLVEPYMIDKLLDVVEKDICSEQKSRFVVISSLPNTINQDAQIHKVLNIFNHKNNRYGKYLKLIIGSEKISIGYNLINARQMHILVQGTISEINQAIYRVLRGTSNFSNETEKYIRIYRHVIFENDQRKYYMKKIKDQVLADKKMGFVRNLLTKYSIEKQIEIQLKKRKTVDQDFTFLVDSYSLAKKEIYIILCKLLFMKIKSIYLGDLKKKYISPEIGLNEFYNSICNFIIEKQLFFNVYTGEKMLINVFDDILYFYDSSTSLKSFFSILLFYKLQINQQTTPEDVCNFHKYFSNFILENDIKNSKKYYEYQLEINNLENKILRERNSGELQIDDYENFSLDEENNIYHNLNFNIGKDHNQIELKKNTIGLKVLQTNENEWKDFVIEGNLSQNVVKKLSKKRKITLLDDDDDDEDYNIRFKVKKYCPSTNPANIKLRFFRNQKYLGDQQSSTLPVHIRKNEKGLEINGRDKIRKFLEILEDASPTAVAILCEKFECEKDNVQKVIEENLYYALEKEEYDLFFEIQNIVNSNFIK